MIYIKNQILQNNALHNAVELFIRQLMLNNMDYRVIYFKMDAIF